MALPPFSLTRPRYDQSTFDGRLRKNFSVVDPRTLFVQRSELDKCLALLDEWKTTGTSKATTAELWYARKVKEAIVHPDTGEIVPRPFRMSGFVPYGAPIVLLMLLPVTTHSLPLTIFAQSFNQSHNAAINWCNRSATAKEAKADILRGYAAALTSSVTVAVGLSATVDRWKGISPVTRAALKSFTPVPAVVTASTLNMVCMRWGEMQKGITVRSEEGEVLGTSKTAARMAITSTGYTRVCMASSAVLLPQIQTFAAECLGIFKRYPRSRLPLQAFFTTWSFGLGLPFALSMSPQESRVDATRLEPEFHGRQTNDGKPIKTVVYNRGL